MYLGTGHKFGRGDGEVESASEGGVGGYIFFSQKKR